MPGKPEQGWYVYGIVESDVEVVPGRTGVADAPVDIARDKRLSALVSTIELDRPLGTPEDLHAHKDLLDATVQMVDGVDDFIDEGNLAIGEVGGLALELAVGDAGDQDDGDVPVLGEAAEVLEEGGAVDLGHHLVEQDDVGSDVADAVHRVPAVVRPVDFEARPAERLGEQLQLVLGVLDDQDLGHKNPSCCLECVRDCFPLAPDGEQTSFQRTAFAPTVLGSRFVSNHMNPSEVPTARDGQHPHRNGLPPNTPTRPSDKL